MVRICPSFPTGRAQSIQITSAPLAQASAGRTGLRDGERKDRGSQYVSSCGCKLELSLSKNVSCPDIQNLHSDATVADVFDRLVARRVLRPSDLGSCYLSYRSHLPPQDLTLSKIGISRDSMLILHWRLRGGAGKGNEKVINHQPTTRCSSF